VLKKLLEENGLKSKPHTIWKMDETGMQLGHRPGKIVLESGSKYLHSRTSGNTETITVIGTINAAGDSLPPHIRLKML